MSDAALTLVLVLAVVLVVVVIVLVRSVVLVREDEIVEVDRLGKPNRTLEAGLHLLVPVVDSIRARRPRD